MHEYENEMFEQLTYEEEQIEEQIYTDCTFHKCEFMNVSFRNCTFRNCVFDKCMIANPKFHFTTMKNTIVKNGMFIGVDWSRLKERTKGSTVLAKVENSMLKYNSFMLLEMRAVAFSDTRLEGCLFEECDLQKAMFASTDFGNTHFRTCNLEQADFREARDYIIDLKTNRMKGSKFSFPEAINMLHSLEIIID